MAERVESLPKLCSEVVVDLHPVFLRRDPEQLLVQREEPPQLCDRPLVVVDP